MKYIINDCCYYISILLHKMYNNIVYNYYYDLPLMVNMKYYVKLGLWYIMTAVFNFQKSINPNCNTITYDDINK